MIKHESIDHNGLFHELIEKFFWEFLELFLPQVLKYMERGAVTFSAQEVLSSINPEKKHITDLLAQVQFQGQHSYFLFHVEPQLPDPSDFRKNLFYGFGRLYEKYDAPIYPIVIFSNESPYKEEENLYRLQFPDFQILEFKFKAIYLNQLNWRDYLGHQNPITSALMAKMQVAKQDRLEVKVECLRMLATLQLDPARTEFIFRFVDTYLRLEGDEEQRFLAEVDKLEPGERKSIMKTLTSWEEKGLVRGRLEGRHEGKAELVSHLLHHKIGQIPLVVENLIFTFKIAQIEDLAEALLDFEDISDLNTWLQNMEM